MWIFKIKVQQFLNGMWVYCPDVRDSHRLPRGHLHVSVVILVAAVKLV